MNVDEIRSVLIEILSSNIFSNEYYVEFDSIRLLQDAQNTLQDEVGITLKEIVEKIEELKNPIIESVEDIRGNLENLKSDIETEVEDTRGRQRTSFNEYIENIENALDDLIYNEEDDVDSLMQGIENIKCLFEEDAGIKGYKKQQSKSRKLSPEESSKLCYENLLRQVRPPF